MQWLVVGGLLSWASFPWVMGGRLAGGSSLSSGCVFADSGDSKEKSVSVQWFSVVWLLPFDCGLSGCMLLGIMFEGGIFAGCIFVGSNIIVGGIVVGRWRHVRQMFWCWGGLVVSWLWPTVVACMVVGHGVLASMVGSVILQVGICRKQHYFGWSCCGWKKATLLWVELFWMDCGSILAGSFAGGGGVCLDRDVMDNIVLRHTIVGWWHGCEQHHWSWNSVCAICMLLLWATGCSIYFHFMAHIRCPCLLSLMRTMCCCSGPQKAMHIMLCLVALSHTFSPLNCSIVDKLLY